jgi:hypothetical protein
LSIQQKNYQAATIINDALTKALCFESNKLLVRCLQRPVYYCHRPL